jgi:hypothetical protein
MALKRGEIKEIESDDEEDEQEDIGIGELMCLCEKMNASPLNMAPMAVRLCHEMSVNLPGHLQSGSE